MFETILEMDETISLEIIYNNLYTFFKNDFIDNKTFLANTIYIDPKSQNKKDDKEEVFWHIITREDKKIKKRILDFDRAKRIRWIKPIIENHDLKEIKMFYHFESNRKIRLYLWLENKDFVVILQKLGSKSSYLVTSFYIDQKYKRKTYEKRYENYINKKHPKLIGCEWF